MPSLTIISHTEHYYTRDGKLVGLAPTVMEVNHLLEIFDRIYHVAMLHDDPAPENTMAYHSDKITFVPIPALGGRGLKAKLQLLKHGLPLLKIIRSTLQHTDYFQFRAPTGIGMFVLPYLVYGYKRKGWFKYAGDWKAANASFTYRIQQKLLLQQCRKVTINGVWPDQPAHCLSFENPCLTQVDLCNGRKVRAEKVWDERRINLCYVGRLEPEKGLDLFLEAIRVLPAEYTDKLGTIHIVGEGHQREAYETQASSLNGRMVFHGRLSREAVHAVFEQCHGLVLPSVSEGFPKVISEAMNYGCIPLVSDVSAIGHYVISGVHGYVFSDLSVSAVAATITAFLDLSSEQFKAFLEVFEGELEQFSYGYYNQRLLKVILCD